MSLTTLSLLLQAVAIICLSVAVYLLSRRVSRLEKPKLIPVDYMKRAIEFQSIAESLCPPSAFEQTLEKVGKDWYVQHFDND